MIEIRSFIRSLRWGRLSAAALSFTLLLGFSLPSQADNLQAPTLRQAIEGRHYIVLNEFGKTKVPPGKVEVLEFFWYGCPHCYRLEPYLEAYESEKPAYVTVRRVAVPFNGVWQVHAQTYYTAERLNLVRRTHRAFFDAIHQGRQPLTNQRTIARFFSEYGVPTDQFNEVFSSFGVTSRLRLARREVDFYRVDGVPQIIINGKYLTSPSYAGSEANMIEVIKQLTQQEYETPRPAANDPNSEG